MPCGGCRKAPKPIKAPSNVGGTVSGGMIKSEQPKGVVKTTSGSGDQRSKVTGLVYIPK